MKIYIKSVTSDKTRDCIFYNFELWGESPKTNILYLVGYSGSGKSTKAKQLAKEYNADIIHLDLYFEGHTEDQNRSSSFDEYLEKNFPDYVKIGWSKDKITMNEWGKTVEEFENQLNAYGRYMYSRGIKVIVEGVELMDDTLYLNKKFFKTQPTVVMRTSQFKSNWRGSRRDEVNPLKYLKNREFNKQTKKEYKQFKDTFKD